MCLGCKEFPEPGKRAASLKKRIVSSLTSCLTARMRPSLLVLIILVLLLVGAFPGWGYSSGWGYYPFGGIGLVLLIVLILALTGRF